MLAARDGLLALAGRLAVDIAQEARHPDGGDMTIRSVAAEIGTIQWVSDRTVERRMSDASWLVDRFPTVWEAQGAGRITAAHSRVIVDAGAHLEDAADREAYAGEALEAVAAESPNRQRAHAAYGKVMDLAIALGGTITGEHGVGRLKQPWLEDYLGSDVLELNQRVKDALDPQGIMNPGAVFARQ